MLFARNSSTQCLGVDGSIQWKILGRQAAWAHYVNVVYFDFDFGTNCLYSLYLTICLKK